jgi:hypothetical protein
MARSHTMTPRRRAALRKAQLASARKRRKRNTVGSSVKRAVRQRASYAKASVQTRRGRRKKKASKGDTGKKATRTKKVMAYTAVGLAGAGAAYGAHKAAGGRVIKYKDVSQGEKPVSFYATKSDHSSMEKRRRVGVEVRTGSPYRGTIRGIAYATTSKRGIRPYTQSRRAARKFAKESKSSARAHKRYLKYRKKDYGVPW